MVEEMSIQEYIVYLEGLIPLGSDINKSFFDRFKKEAKYMGGKWYSWDETKSESSDLRVLFIKGCLRIMEIKFEEKY